MKLFKLLRFTVYEFHKNILLLRMLTPFLVEGVSMYGDVTPETISERRTTKTLRILHRTHVFKNASLNHSHLFRILL